jgi:hypothetical protein
LILLLALLAGLLIGLLLARWRRRPWQTPRLRAAWLVLLAFLPQLFAAYLPADALPIPDALAGASIVLSQCLLLVFCWLNRRLAGVWLLALGTTCNLLVIALNGGFMPISPQTAGRLLGPQAATLEAGGRFGWKDILLLPEQTRLACLSDRFLPPEGFFYQVAFSFGDVLIAAGAFWLAVSPAYRQVQTSVSSEAMPC